MKHIWERATKETSKNINARDVEEKAFVAALPKHRMKYNICVKLEDSIKG